MESSLRPMSLGEILDRTAQLYRSHFVLFVGISAVYAGMLLVLNLLQIGVTQLLKAEHMASQQLWATAGFLALIFPLSVVAGGIAVAANNRAVAWVNLGQPATIRGAYKSILPRTWSYVWLMFLMQVIIYTPFVLIYGGMLLYMWKTGVFNAAKAQHTDPQAAIALIIVFGIFLFLIVAWMIYAILMGLRYSLAIPASVVETLKARAAMRRSIELSKSSRGRIFVLILLILIIELGLVLVSQGFFILAAFKNHMVLPLWAQILQQVVGFLTNSFIGPMYATGLTLFYYDQRIRKEGYDIEWMMEAAGLSWPPTWSGIDPGTAQSAPGALAIETLSVPVEIDREARARAADDETAGSGVEGAAAEGGRVTATDPAASDGTETIAAESTSAEPTSPGTDHEQR